MTSGIERVQKVRNAALAALFACALWLPLADNLLDIDPAPAVVESRTPAKAPDPTRNRLPTLTADLESIRTYPGRFQTFHKRHVGFRKTLVNGYGLIKVHGLGLSTTDKILLGKDGWLYHVANKQIEYFRGDLQYTEKDLAAWKELLEARHDWLSKRDINYLFVVVPDKTTLYPEHLPDGIRPAGSGRLMDQLVAYLGEHSKIRILDLRPALRAAKKSQARPIYWAEDFHWNYVGAWAGYREIIQRLDARHPAVGKPMAWGDFKVSETTYKGELHEMLAAGERHEPGLYLEPRAEWQAKRVPFSLNRKDYPWPVYLPWNAPVAMERKDRKLRMLMFHDSMTFWLRPYLSEHFRRSVYIFHTDATRTVPDLASLRILVEKEKPDIVIEERTEMYLKDVPADPALLCAARKDRFDASTQVLLRIDAGRGWMGTERLGKDASILKENGALVIRSTGNDPSVILPAFPFPRIPSKASVIIRIDITMPADSTLQVFYMTESGKTPDEKRSVRYNLKKGRTEFFLELKNLEMAGRLRFDPGLVPGDYILHALEVRAVARMK